MKLQAKRTNKRTNNLLNKIITVMNTIGELYANSNQPNPTTVVREATDTCKPLLRLTSKVSDYGVVEGNDYMGVMLDDRLVRVQLEDFVVTIAVDYFNVKEL